MGRPSSDIERRLRVNAAAIKSDTGKPIELDRGPIALTYVRFTPESDIKCDIMGCPLWANSGDHSQAAFCVRVCRGVAKRVVIYISSITVDNKSPLMHPRCLILAARFRQLSGELFPTSVHRCSSALLKLNAANRLLFFI